MGAHQPVHPNARNRPLRWTVLPLVAVALVLSARTGRGEGRLAPPTAGETRGEEPDSEPGRYSLRLED